MAVGLGPVDFVLDREPALPKRGAHSQFSAHVDCGQMGGCG